MEAEPPGYIPRRSLETREKWLRHPWTPASQILRTLRSSGTPHLLTGSAWECPMQGSALPVWKVVVWVIKFISYGCIRHGGRASGKHSQAEPGNEKRRRSLGTKKKGGAWGRKKTFLVLGSLLFVQYIRYVHAFLGDQVIPIQPAGKSFDKHLPAPARQSLAL